MDSAKMCAVCMGEPVFPVQLDCQHIFCYLCVKGVVNASNRCPMCRRTIDVDILKRPKFVSNGLSGGDRPSGDFESSPQWFYEGKGGYWAYDHSNARLLEQAFTSDQKMCEITISGNIYCVDFVRLIQYQKYIPSRKRAVKRDLLSNIEAKGIAGVSKYLVRDIFTAHHSKSPSKRNASDSGHSADKQSVSSSANDTVGDLANNSANDSDDCDQNDEPLSKKIKVEVKEEPNSTSDD